MARNPSCYLHLGFTLHLLSFGALLAGYCTPYWTVVKMSTGNVRALGLVVNCDIKGCEMLHVTEARVVFVVVFGMATGCVLFSLFALQAFCLSLCNASCRHRNMGACLSYFSMFVAFSLGGTLGLYQIDLREEDKPDVMSMKIGWSRLAVIGSSAGFLLGALLSIADFVRRHRLQRQEIQKMAEAKSRLITVSEQTRKQQQQQNQGHPAGVRAGQQPQQQQRGPGMSRPAPVGPAQTRWATAATAASAAMCLDKRPRKMAATVQASMKLMEVEKLRGVDKKRIHVQRMNTGDKGQDGNSVTISGSRCITVDERSKKDKDGSHQSGDNATTPRRTRSKVNNENVDQSMADAAKKYKLTKSSHVESLDDKRPTLPVVEEETHASTGTGKRCLDSRDKRRSSDARPIAPTSPQPTRKRRDSEAETLKTSTVKDGRGKDTEQTKGDNLLSLEEKMGGGGDKASNEIYGRGKGTGGERRVSTVEDALKSVRSMLASINEADNTPLPDSKASCSLDSSVDSKNPPLRRRLPSIEESFSDTERKRNPDKRLPKLESPSMSQDSRRLVDKDKDNDGKARKVGHFVNTDAVGRKQSRSLESDKDGDAGSEVLNNWSKSTDSRGDAPDDERGKQRDRKRRPEGGVKPLDTASSLDKVQSLPESLDKTQSLPESLDKTQSLSDSLDKSQSLSEEQMKRKQIVECLINAKKERKRKRITQ